MQGPPHNVTGPKINHHVVFFIYFKHNLFIEKMLEKINNQRVEKKVTWGQQFQTSAPLHL